LGARAPARRAQGQAQRRGGGAARGRAGAYGQGGRGGDGARERRRGRSDGGSGAQLRLVAPAGAVGAQQGDAAPRKALVDDVVSGRAPALSAAWAATAAECRAV